MASSIKIYWDSCQQVVPDSFGISVNHTDDKYSKVISISDATGVDKEPADLSTFMFGLIDHCSSDFVPGETRWSFQNIARIANSVPVTLYSRVTVNVETVVLNCQECNQFLKGHNVIVHIVVLNCQECNQCLNCHVSGHKNF